MAFIQLSQARLYVSAQWFDLKMREARAQLAFTPQAGSADHAGRRQALQVAIVVGHERVSRILALCDGGDAESSLQVHRHILHRMHRDVRLPGIKCEFEFLDEQTLAADFRERRAEHAVALGGHAKQLRLQRRIERLQPCFDMARLPHRQCAFARGDGDSGRMIHGGRQTSGYLCNEDKMSGRCMTAAARDTWYLNEIFGYVCRSTFPAKSAASTRSFHALPCVGSANPSWVGRRPFPPQEKPCARCGLRPHVLPAGF